MATPARKAEVPRRDKVMVAVCPWFLLDALTLEETRVGRVLLNVRSVTLLGRIFGRASPAPKYPV